MAPFPLLTPSRAFPPLRGAARRLNLPLALAVAVAVTALFVTLGLPLFRVFGEAFSSEGMEVSRSLVGNAMMRTTAMNTVVLGLSVATVGVLLAFLFAVLQAKMDVPFKRTLHVLAVLPVVSPPFALATAVIVLFGRNGLISKGVFGVGYDIYGLDGLVVVLSLSFFPVVYLSLLGMLQRLDPALDEAATNLGASEWHVFRTVTVPMLIPGVASGFLLLFVEAIADLANPLVLGGDYSVIAARAYLSIIGEFDVLTGSVLSLSLFAPALMVYLLQRYWIDRRVVFSITGKSAGRPRLYRGALRWPLFAVVCLIALVIAVIYTTIVVGAFTIVPGVNHGLTVEHFEFVLLGIGSQAMIDTTVLAVAATPVAGLLGMLIGWLTVRKLRRTSGLMDFAAMLGIAVPGTVLGIGYLIAFRPDNLVAGVTVIPSLAGGSALAGGAVAIVMVFAVRSLPASVRAAVSSLQQIHPAIEEASTSLGASDLTTFRKITLPLIRTALLAGLTFAIARSMTTLSPIVFLTTPETKIMTSQILAEVDAGRFGNAFAYSCVLMVIVLVIIGVIRLVLKEPDVLPTAQKFRSAARPEEIP
ncbi:MAG: iron(III) transport system permease protein [Actinomycetota bacterium]|nr:iron(III) transport system permease protein [Actinomycetota bacterium]